VTPALEARIRHLDGRVPPDAVAHIHPDLADAALPMMGLPMMGLNMSARGVPGREGLLLELGQGRRGVGEQRAVPLDPVVLELRG
jgi:hypothetical protein